MAAAKGIRVSEPSPIAAPVKPRPAPDVTGAIARAATATGTDFSYLMAQARLESGLDPKARAATSSAAGLYQFTGQTWLAMLDKHGAAYGLPGAGDAASRSQLLALRSDPELSALMAGERANDNRDFLSGLLGRDPDPSELYLAHFLGAEGAGRFLSALSSNPAQSAAALHGGERFGSILIGHLDGVSGRVARAGVAVRARAADNTGGCRPACVTRCERPPASPGRSL